MPYCAWCGQEVANVSTAPCPHCGRPMDGTPAPPAPGAPYAPPGAPYAPGTQYPAPPPSSGSRTAIIVIVVIVGLLVLIAVGGIIAAIAIPNLLTATQRAKQKRTMADLRTIATALEARATDKNEYPNVTSVDDLRPLLQTEYVMHLPTQDGWGHPFRYACVPPVTSGPCQGYVVGSGGKDGIFETDDLARAAASPPKTTTNFDCDILYSNGNFIESPEGVGGH